MTAETGTLARDTGVAHRVLRSPVIAGLAIILVANAAALAGAAWNRSGEPDATLVLSERELRPFPPGGADRDDSGMTLRLNWRWMTRDDVDASPPYRSGATAMLFEYRPGSPAWLDSAKLAALGFNVHPPSDSVDAQHWFARQVPRDVILVLEMDGDAAATMRDRMRDRVREAQARVADLPGDEQLLEQGQAAMRALLAEERDASRLFAIDAGLDRAELRARYPDRTRHALARGRIRIMRPFRIEYDPTGAPMRDSVRPLVGTIDDLLVPDITVPLAARGAFEQLGASGERRWEARYAPFSVTVAWGRRLEPWLVRAERRR